MDRGLLRELGSRLERRTACGLAVSDRELFISIDGATLTGKLARHRRT
jgi:hypothetical protein